MRRVVVLILAVCLLSPSAALASGRSVVRDCTDNGRIDSRHSQSDYKDALRRLPSDVDEYTDCRQIIEAARRRDARRQPGGGGGSGGGSGGGGGGTGGVSGGGGGSAGTLGGFDTPTAPPTANVPVSPAESSALSQAAGGGGRAVQVAGEPVTPGGSGITEAAFRNDLPGPLLAMVILLGLGALATTVSGARARGFHAPPAVLRVVDRVFPRRA